MIAIGILSKQTGVKIETIRYYEKIGLMPTADRKASGHRLYNASSTARLRFIRRARELGFCLSDIKNLLGPEETPPDCAEVYALTRRHLHDIQARIADLKKLEKTLQQMAAQCKKGITPDCPIIEALGDKNL